jgi:hypothetical protein
VYSIVGGFMIDVHAPEGKTEEVIQVAMDHHATQRTIAKNDASTR